MLYRANALIGSAGAEPCTDEQVERLLHALAPYSGAVVVEPDGLRLLFDVEGGATPGFGGALLANLPRAMGQVRLVLVQSGLVGAPVNGIGIEREAG